MIINYKICVFFSTKWEEDYLSIVVIFNVNKQIIK